jgi:hypothetical protein
MIHAVIEQWHAHMRGELKNGLDILLDDNCVFLSPIVFTPQVGKEITKTKSSFNASCLGKH